MFCFSWALFFAFDLKIHFASSELFLFLFPLSWLQRTWVLQLCPVFFWRCFLRFSHLQVRAPGACFTKLWLLPYWILWLWHRTFLFFFFSSVTELPSISFHWRKKWQPTPAFFPGKSHGQRSLAGYSPWGCTESDMT